MPGSSGARDTRGYPAIGDYALIGDCHASALVSTRGSIDWCCLPRFDSDSCFARLLDWQRGGHFSIAPATRFESRREYLDGTLVLVTHFRTPRGEARLTDFFAMRHGGRQHPRRELVRIIEGVSGTVRMQLAVSPRLDFGEVKPWIRAVSDTAFAAVGSNTRLLIYGDVGLELAGEHDLCGSFELRQGVRRHLAMHFVSPVSGDELSAGAHTADGLDAHLRETVAWWREWTSKLGRRPRAGVSVSRSAIVLKALTYAPTGAIIAAPTTSLPETIGGERNWDYRYSWIRDSVFTVHALADLGAVAEADGFRRFIQMSAAGNADELQVIYGVDGKRRLTEIELPHLEGWRRSKPVRIGNAAAKQFQGDMYGLLLELSWRWSRRGNAPDRDYWDFLVELVEAAIARWRQPDLGIWEIRSEPRHFVHSKVMCWAAVNRGIELAADYGLPAPLARWRRERAAIRRAVERHGVDRRGGYFVESFGSRAVDAALLLLPSVSFVPYDDPRMQGTVDVVACELAAGGLIMRYRTEDGLRGAEGVFVACSFWLVECYARQGRLQDARSLFERAERTANDLGLFAEEYAPRTRQLLGNFPQGLTHLAHISAALALEAAEAGRAQPADEPARQ